MQLVALQNLLDNISFAILFLTMLVYWVNLAFPGAGWLRQIGTAGMAIANLSIATLLGARWIEAGYFPLSNLYESLFFLAWGITTMHLVANSIGNAENNGRKLIGAFTAPVAMGITAFAALALPDQMQAAEPLVPALKSNWLMMHVSVMLLSYAALMVGSVLAIAFLIVTRGQPIKLSGNSLGLSLTPPSANGQRDQQVSQPRQDHNGEQLVAANIPGNGSQGSTLVLDPPQNQSEPQPQLSLKRLSLGETLDNLSYRMIGLGFPLLTIGIIAGAVWANEAWGSYWSWDPKETWALITWLVFAAYLHTRITKGWQGRKPAILASAGFLVVWICYLGVNLLGKGLHSYGWFL
ncbi:Cytochrome c biogenesis protein ccsA [Thalassoporum mexicanum PCC 7367]|uniref:c-type cytochrome biogenesis protein CcsB n=1 Tax=Thalassoporum mexicanum TaxID=3457544 RepID=UPI00029F9583|nr:c-type cytochrome biogenesis protein CcsB [Pseudanabaena sp. PCC 7367]AFY71491.1 Cytochrome c biogenesis protein ccsA [Pseudanabaena sp. PCC 7367]